MRHDELFDEFDRMFADLARGSRHPRFVPNTDVYASADESALVVQVELAGADAESLNVHVDERSLYIAGRRVERDTAERGAILRKEIEYGEFSKKIHLPAPVSYEEATAIYRDGILTIRLPLAQTETLPVSRTQIRMTVRRTPA